MNWTSLNKAIVLALLLSFGVIQNAMCNSATVTDAIGTQEVWTFQEILNENKLTSKINQVDGKGITQTWDTRGNLLSRTDAEGRTTTYSYNSKNQRISMTEAYGTSYARTMTYEYLDADTDLITKVTSPSIFAGNFKETITTYDSRLNVTSITINGFNADGKIVTRVTSFSHNAYGKITQINGPRIDVDDITTLRYYDCNTGAHCGQLSQVFNALGYSTTYDAYDGAARLLRSTDLNGVVTTNTYHPRGWLLSSTRTPPEGAARTTDYEYDNEGQLTRASLPDGTHMQYVYDDAHNLTEISDNLGNKVTYFYDAKGNRTKELVFDPDGTLVRSLVTAYDVRNFISSINDGGSVTEMINDAVGNLSALTDPKQNPSTNTSFDALDRLTTIIDSLSNNTEYEYNVADELVQTTAPNQASTQYEFDDLGDLTKEESPDRGTLTYTHDAIGNVTSITDDRGITRTYQYDSLNRLTKISYPNESENVEFEYDLSNFSGLPDICEITLEDEIECIFSGLEGICEIALNGALECVVPELVENCEIIPGDQIKCVLTDLLAGDSNPDENNGFTFSYDTGRLSRVSDETGQTNYQYDAWGNVTELTKVVLGVNYTWKYSYDEMNRQIKITYPNGRQVGYVRDAIGRIVDVNTTVNDQTTAIVTGRQYRADGLRLEHLFGNGLSGTRQYDVQGRLQQQITADSNLRYFSHDSNGNIESILDGKGQRDFIYDVLDRLESQNLNSTVSSYQYDENGNRTQKNITGETQSQYIYQTATNRLSSIQGDNINLDASGNTLLDQAGNRTFEYNQRGRIKKVLVGGSQVASYQYDSDGLRIKKITPEHSTIYHYGFDGKILAESLPTGEIEKEYFYADGELIAMIITDSEPITDDQNLTADITSPAAGATLNSNSVFISS